jgi:alpha-L-rhamnosidase
MLRHSFVVEEGLFPLCHGATVAETRKGLLVAFFAGKREAVDTAIYAVRWRGGTWGRIRKVAVGRARDGSPSACWNPVLHVARDGTAVCFYKVGPNCTDWWGMESRSSDDGVTWTASEPLPEGKYGPIRGAALRRPDGSLLCPSSTEFERWKVHFERCDDLGQSWTRTADVPDPEGLEPIQPTLLDLGGGRLRALCRTRRAGVVAETLSEDDGRTWSPVRATSLPNPNSAIDALRLQDGRFLLALNPTGMLKDRWTGPRHPLVLALSDDGEHWDRATVLEDGDGEYSYPALLQDARGVVHVVYSWERTAIRHASIDPRDLRKEGPLPLASDLRPA